MLLIKCYVLGAFFVSIGVTIVGVLYGHKAGTPKYKKKNKDKLLHKIKRDSKAIHFTFEECTFTRLDTIKKSSRWGDSQSTSLGVDRKGKREEFKESKTEISCKKPDDKRAFTATFPMDLDIVKTSTHQHGGITVYLENEDEYTRFEEDEYYMDLGFLEPEEIT